MDDQGRGLPSVRITFTDAEDNAVTTVTDIQGNFTRSGLSGSYEITASKDGYEIDRVEVSGPDDNLILLAEETIPEVYSVSGKVVDDQGRGIPSVVVTFTGDNTVTTLTDAQGNFTRSNLSGAYEITAAKDGYIIDGSFDVASPDRNIVFLAKETAPTIYTVSGKVVDDQGRGLPSVRIVFTDAGGSTLTTLTDSQGSFSREGLIGSYRVTAEKDGYLIIDSFDVT